MRKDIYQALLVTIFSVLSSVFFLLLGTSHVVKVPATEFGHRCDKSLSMLRVILCHLMPLKYRHHSMVYSLPYLLTYIGHAMPMLGQEGGEVCCGSMDFSRNS